MPSPRGNTKFATWNDLRCVCAPHPLLATYGRREDGTAYIHIRVFKGSRIYSEALVTSGTTELRCRNCYRWMRVTIRDEIAALEETGTPEAVEK